MKEGKEDSGKEGMESLPWKENTFSSFKKKKQRLSGEMDRQK